MRCTICRELLELSLHVITKTRGKQYRWGNPGAGLPGTPSRIPYSPIRRTTHTPSPSPYSLCVNTHNHRLLGQTSQNFTSYKQEENETLKEFSHSVQILSITSGHVIALKVCYMNSTADSELSNNLVVIQTDRACLLRILYYTQKSIEFN